MPAQSSLQRVAYSPGEFAELFGKSQTWGYRQIYAGKVKAITEHGRILIPAAEVERILGKAAEYTGSEKPRASKKHIDVIEERNRAWRDFVAKRRAPDVELKGRAEPQQKVSEKSMARREVMARLTRKR